MILTNGNVMIIRVNFLCSVTLHSVLYPKQNKTKNPSGKYTAVSDREPDVTLITHSLFSYFTYLQPPLVPCCSEPACSFRMTPQIFFHFFFYILHVHRPHFYIYIYICSYIHIHVMCYETQNCWPKVRNIMSKNEWLLICLLCSVLEMGWASFVLSCQPVNILTQRWSCAGNKNI